MIIKLSKTGKKLKNPYEMSMSDVLKQDARLFINNIPVLSKSACRRKMEDIVINSKDPSTMYPGYMEDLKQRLNELDGF